MIALVDKPHVVYKQLSKIITHIKGNDVVSLNGYRALIGQRDLMKSLTNDGETTSAQVLFEFEDSDEHYIIHNIGGEYVSDYEEFIEYVKEKQHEEEGQTPYI